MVGILLVIMNENARHNTNSGLRRRGCWARRFAVDVRFVCVLLRCAVSVALLLFVVVDGASASIILCSFSSLT